MIILNLVLMDTLLQRNDVDLTQGIESLVVSILVLMDTLLQR